MDHYKYPGRKSKLKNLFQVEIGFCYLHVILKIRKALILWWYITWQGPAFRKI